MLEISLLTNIEKNILCATIQLFVKTKMEWTASDIKAKNLAQVSSPEESGCHI